MEQIYFQNQKDSRFRREKRWFMRKKATTRAGIILLGILSTVWFLVRVIPKPSRAGYPCMRVAAPFASAFVLYIAGMATSVFAVKKIRTSFRNSRYFTGAGFILLLTWAFLFIQFHDRVPSYAGNPSSIDSVNQPIGVARGIFPGRVVWVWNRDATNENCTNSPGDYWWQNENTIPSVAEAMLSDGIRTLTGMSTDSLAWNALFRYHNQTHGHGNSGYTQGEKIAIKINLTTGYLADVDTSTYQKIDAIDAMDCSPQMVLSLLKQLVNVVGVNESDISVGDPDRLFYDPIYGMLHSVFPDVNYLDRFGKHGRTRAIPSSAPVLFYSDGVLVDSLPQAFVEADYMINMACLKQHDAAGGTFCAKNHFGSVCREWSSHIHYSLPSPDGSGTGNLGYGKYRCLVDLMEHKDLGDKTFLFMLDGLWGGDLPVCVPKKWQMAPFSNDWPSSLILSQDHVAIESVGFDFVRAEFPFFSHMYGADDYLHQAADSSLWAPGITYDPDHTGNLTASMGTHEHWNNDTAKKYSRNLGTGNGIELVRHFVTGIGEIHGGRTEDNPITCFPVPSRGRVTLSMTGNEVPGSEKQIRIFNSAGQIVEKLTWPAGRSAMILERNDLPAGVYFLSVRSTDPFFEKHARIVIVD